MADYIERLDTLKELALLDTGEEEYTDNISRTRATIAITNIHAADVVPVVHGEWERIPYSFVGGYRCPRCGQKTMENFWLYCPNCGLKMDGERKESAYEI